MAPDRTETEGEIAISLAKPPIGITRVVADLTREGFRQKTITLAISDSIPSAIGVFRNVETGWWHLKVEAFDREGLCRYRGERDINVLPGETTIAELDLLPTTGNIEIRVRWGINVPPVIIPDHTKWEWTRDDRGGGSQNSLLFNMRIISILPVNHVHFVNRTVNTGNAVYRFKVRGGNFKFAWRISLNDSTQGTALILQKDQGTKISVIHTKWENFYYGWPNSYNYFSNSLNIRWDSTSWHAVEIHDTGSDIRVFIDGAYRDFFINQIPVSEFLADVGTGGLGIGNDEYETISYKEMEIVR